MKETLKSTASSTDETALQSEDANDGPDLYECSGCGAVFISRPSNCSECEDDDFSNLGKFE